MLLSWRSFSFRGSSYCALLVLCAIALLYHFWNNGSIRNAYIQHVQPLLSNEIPKTIWYKLGPKGLNSDTQGWTDSCIRSNPNYEAKFMTDETADEYVKKAYASRPDILETYLGFPVPIWKADMLRYLLLFDQGGIWSDLDVSCEDIPIDDWIPSQYKDNAGVIVGLEFDMGWGEPFPRQFESWTIMAKPRSPHMLRVIEDIIEVTHERMQHFNVSIESLTLEMTGDVVDYTGPRRLTSGIFNSLGKTLNRTVAPEEIAALIQPKLIGDVLVMPGRSFAASANTYGKEVEEKLPPKLVSHHYAGSWKNPHGGES